MDNNILTEFEREVLEGLLSPYQDRVSAIVRDKDYVICGVSGYDGYIGCPISPDLPFDGMDKWRIYTPTELGLFF